MVTLLDPHLTEIGLDLMFLGDLDAASAERARAHLEACQSCRAAYKTLEGAARRFEGSVFARTEARVSRALRTPTLVPAPARKRATSWRWTWASAVMAAATVGFAVLLIRPDVAKRMAGTSDDPGPELREKGYPSLSIYARRSDRVFRVESGSHVQPGDRLRFTAEPAGYPYLLVASIDAAGTATIFFPYGGAGSAKIDAHQHFESDSSIVLDDTRGPERLYALFSRRRPLDAGMVGRALREIGARGPEQIRRTLRLDLATDSQESVLQESVLIEK